MGQAAAKGAMDLSWSVGQRLEFIEFRLFWEGFVNRSHLTEKFDISVPQASTDLANYQKFAPSNMIYDLSGKAYVPSANFKPLFLKPSARDYLTQLRLIQDGAAKVEDTWLGTLPPFDIVPLVRRRASETKLQKILQAIRQKRGLHIKYQSETRPEPTWRWIAPHALGFDGFRWHVRAWCHTRTDFRDFVLARMLTLDKDREEHIDPARDREWHETVVMRIGPNPKLSPDFQEAIKLDFGMQDGVLELPARVCLSYYVEKHLGLDLAQYKDVPAKRQQIVLLNRDEVERTRQAVKAAAPSTA